MEESIINKPIDFRFGTEDEYRELWDLGHLSDEDLYFTERDMDLGDREITLSNLYIGHSKIGDTYDSAYLDTPSKRVTNPIGLITYGMPLNDILKMTGGSISRLIDMMLFTDREPTVEECGIITGFIPKNDVGDNWTSWSDITSWIQNYAVQDFDPNKYYNFMEIETEYDTTFSIDPDEAASVEEYDGYDMGMYTGRMFIAIPYTDGGKDIDTIVDEVFKDIYSVENGGLVDNFLQLQNADMDFGETTYRYKIYLFGSNQMISSRLRMSYCVRIK